MRHYSVLYGKLGALRPDFLSPEDLQRMGEYADYDQVLSYLVSRNLVGKIEERPSPREIERALRERFLKKLKSFCLYLPGKESKFFEFLLYKYDIYNLKILLALHFSQHDRDVAKFVYANTPLFKRYAFLIDRESFVDKDLLLAFKGTPIFPFLMHTYRNYKEKGDLFFLDTVLEDEYYQKMLEVLREVKDEALTEVMAKVLLVHDVIWGMRMHFIYQMAREEIFYYLVLPIPKVPTQSILALFSAKRIGEFRDSLRTFLSRWVSDLKVEDLPGDLEGIKKRVWDGLLNFLWQHSFSLNVFSLSGVVAWIVAQEMLMDKVGFILYEKFLERMEPRENAGVILTR